jgi:hypothetical protein
MKTVSPSLGKWLFQILIAGALLQIVQPLSAGDIAVSVSVGGGYCGPVRVHGDYGYGGGYRGGYGAGCGSYSGYGYYGGYHRAYCPPVRYYSAPAVCYPNVGYSSYSYWGPPTVYYSTGVRVAPRRDIYRVPPPKVYVGRVVDNFH